MYCFLTFTAVHRKHFSTNKQQEGQINETLNRYHKDLDLNNIVVYRPDPKQWICKQRPLLGNARNIYACNNRTTGLCNPFLSSGSVNTPTTIGVLLETVFSFRYVQSGYKEKFSWESTVEFRNSKWAVSRELGSAREAERWRSGVECYTQRTTASPRKLKKLHCVKSVAKQRLVETLIDWGNQSVCVSDL
jgi:hypothetical protein